MSVVFVVVASGSVIGGVTLCSLMDGSVKISRVVCGVISCSSIVGYQRQKFGMYSGDCIA